MASDEIEARLTALLATVARLEDDLARATRPRPHAMWETGRCPGCGGGRLLHVRHIDDLNQSHTVPLSLQKDFSRWSGLRTAGGHLEAWVCRECRLVQWRAATLADVFPDGDDVIEVDAPPDPEATGGPYR